jgi:1-acyl-sn-glycerol-3-phosphate acyltransferase
LARPLFQFLYYNYFRVDAKGVANIPAKGPAIIVANHSGTLPYDGTMTHLAVYNELKSKRLVRFLVDDFVFQIPCLRGFIERTGGVRASFANAEKLLRDGNLVVIFPEGVAGVGKTYDEKYRLLPFSRGGFVRLAVKVRAPIIPLSIIGAEEIHPLIWKSKELGRMLGVPFMPFTPTFPWLGPLGLVPLPSKWKLIFGKPVRYAKAKSSDARNDKFIAHEAEKMRLVIQKTLDRELKKRKSIWI